MTEAQARLIQAASHIAGGIAGSAFAEARRQPLSTEEFKRIAEISVQIAGAIEEAAMRPK